MIRRPNISLLGVLVVIASLVCAGWITQWQASKQPNAIKRVGMDTDAVVSSSGQLVRFTDLEVGQVYTVGTSQAQPTAVRFLKVTIRLTTPRERKLATMKCEAEVDGTTFGAIVRGTASFPEPGQRGYDQVIVQFDPRTADRLRIHCRERTVITFRTTEVILDPGLGTPEGRRLIDRSAGVSIQSTDSTSEPIP